MHGNFEESLWILGSGLKSTLPEAGIRVSISTDPQGPGIAHGAAYDSAAAVPDGFLIYGPGIFELRPLVAHSKV